MSVRRTIGLTLPAAALILFACIGCHSLPPIPPADLTAEGWLVRQGQAVWKPNRHRPELAGELLVATHTNAEYLVEFTKTPFTLVSARQGAGLWRVEFGPDHRAWQGRGEAPRRLSWFELPHVLAGNPASRAWAFRQTNGTWRLENERTGEWLEGAFPP